MRLVTKSFIGLAMLASATCARASKYDPRQVPADAQWVVFADMDVISSSKVWGIVEKPLEANADYQKGVNQVAVLTGMHFPKDLHSVTLYGRSERPDDAVLLVRANMNRQRIVGLVSLAPGNNTDEENGRDIYSWSQGGKQVYGAFAADDLVVIARTRKTLDNALATLDGKNAPLDADSVLNSGQHLGVLFYLTGKNFASLGAQAVLLRQVQSGWVSIGEDSDSLVVSASATVADPQKARQLAASVEGIKALASLSLMEKNDQSQVKDFTQIIDGLTSKAEEKTVSIQVPIPLDIISRRIAHAGFNVHLDLNSSIDVHIPGKKSTTKQ